MNFMAEINTVRKLPFVPESLAKTQIFSSRVGTLAAVRMRSDRPTREIKLSACQKVTHIDKSTVFSDPIPIQALTQLIMLVREVVKVPEWLRIVHPFHLHGVLL